ncbi:MAG: hypothetical protein BWY52_02915 [Chloroflexi bacterium ADurb.Bin325]|nr:MAG: hypothetical protein BWY52_02915 [Chloroflexi bacterium ADurb.Bin325]
MATHDKLIAKWRNNPRDVRFEEIDRVLLRVGFTKRQRGTSHAVYTKDAYRLTIPFRQPHILPVYVRQVLQVLDELQELRDEE